MHLLSIAAVHAFTAHPSCGILQNLYQETQEDGKSCCDGTLTFGNVMCIPAEASVWKRDADARIHKYRKIFQAVTFVTKNATNSTVPLSGCNITLTHRRHDFFHLAVKAKKVGEKQTYRDIIKELRPAGVSFPNAFKYKQRNKGWAGGALDGAMQYIDVPLRFHFLIPGSFNIMETVLTEDLVDGVRALFPTFLGLLNSSFPYATELSSADLGKYIKYQIHYAITKHDSKVYEYDVMNMFSSLATLPEDETEYASAPYSEIYTVWLDEGKTKDAYLDDVASWILYAQTLTSKPLVMNDLALTTERGTPINYADYTDGTTKHVPQEMYSAVAVLNSLNSKLSALGGRKIDKIGNMGRFNQRGVAAVNTDGTKSYFYKDWMTPDEVKDNIDYLARLEIPVSITEFEPASASMNRIDPSVWSNRTLLLEKMEEWLTIYFSMPSIDKVVYWNLDAQNQALPLATNDGVELTDAGLKWKELTQSVWSTVMDVQVSDEYGNVVYDGFKGIVAAHLECSDRMYAVEFHTEPLANQVFVLV